MAAGNRVAVIGANIGCTLHVRALRAAGFEVAALVGRDAARTAARAAHFGVAAETSVERALDGDVDAVVVATPPETHHALTMKAIAAGKHVLCEKPFALDPGHAREMRDAAKAAGVVHRVVHEFRWFAHNAMLRRLVRDGALGAPIQIVAEFDHSLCASPRIDVPDWWREGERGGGWLRNYNAHGIDLVRYMLGEFAAVSGVVHPGADRGMRADDSYAFGFTLANGAQGAMTGSCRAWDFHASTRVIGSDATATIGMAGLSLADKHGVRAVETPPDLAEALRGDGPVIAAPDETLPQMDETLYVATHSSDHGFAEQVGLCSAFLSQIRDSAYRNPAIADFDDGVAHVEVIAAVERSAKERRWIDLA